MEEKYYGHQLNILSICYVSIERKMIVIFHQKSLSYILKNVMLVWVGELIIGMFLKTIKRLKITQFPVNSNIATTGYILQGQTKTRMIVPSWDCRVKTWIYVVSWRIRTLDRLLLVKKMDDNLKKYQVSDFLKGEEERLSNLDKEFRIDINWKWKKSWFSFIN